LLTRINNSNYLKSLSGVGILPASIDLTILASILSGFLESVCASWENFQLILSGKEYLPAPEVAFLLRMMDISVQDYVY
jgi:hypothetical protein